MIPILSSSSPNGRYILQKYPWEVRAQWIETPELLDTQTNTALLHFENACWSLESATWLEGSLVLLRLRRYPGNHIPFSFEASIDCENQTATVGNTPVQLGDLEATLERAYTQGQQLWNASQRRPLRGIR